MPQPVCDSAALASILFQRHNFFDPQPIKGAAAYIFRHILHDWPDESCIEILRQTISAMDKNRSRILIVDQVMQDLLQGLSSQAGTASCASGIAVLGLCL